MKKNTTKIFIAAVFLTISGTAFAQEGRVGINTSTPAATLDVVASPTVPTRIDGFIAPRLKGTELQSKNALYTAAQDGAIVYVTEVLTATDDKTLNVTSIGYYYFDKTVGTAGRWMKIANPTAVVAYQEPWNNASDNQPATSNTSDIYQLGKVGINTNSPSNNLHVKGTSPGNDEVIVKVEDNNMSSGNKVLIKLGKNDSGKKDAADIIYYYDADNSNSNRIDFGFSGNSESMSLTSQGNFGIGTNAPTQKLDVNGASRLRGQIYDNNNNAGANGQVLSTNSSGQVVWQNNVAITPAVTAVFPKTVQNMTWDQEGYTGTTLTLPPGKWSVQVAILIDTTISDAGYAGWFRTSFSDSPASTSASSDFVGATKASGAITGPAQFGLVSGTVIIYNTSGASKTYYLVKQAYYPNIFGNAQGNWVVKNFGRGIASEDQIIAYPMN